MRPSPALGHALFDTAVGRCALAWAPQACARCSCPSRDDAATVARLLRASGPCQAATTATRCCRCDPGHTGAAAGAQAGLARGGAGHDPGVRLSPARVCHHPRHTARPGAHLRRHRRATGQQGLARAVGQALGLNPFAPVVPCHRVLGRGFRRAASLPPAARLPSCACCRSRGLAGATPKRCLAFDKCRDRRAQRKSPMGARHIGLSIFLERVKGNRTLV